MPNEMLLFFPYFFLLSLPFSACCYLLCFFFLFLLLLFRFKISLDFVQRIISFTSLICKGGNLLLASLGSKYNFFYYESLHFVLEKYFSIPTRVRVSLSHSFAMFLFVNLYASMLCYVVKQSFCFFLKMSSM